VVTLLDLNTPMESVDAELSDDALIDTLMLVASQRRAAPGADNRAPVDTGAADPLDDDALITWEDADQDAR
jgi:hypothetical protein